MDCCGYGHALTRRQWIWSTVLTSVAAMLGGGVAPRGSTAAAQTAETASAVLDILRKSISVDVHTHGGTTGIVSKAPPTAISRTACVRDRSRSRASRTCWTLPSSAGMRPASSPRCARPSRCRSRGGA